MLKHSLQKGILKGALGLAYLENNEIDKSSVKYKSNISTTTVSLGQDEILISKTIAEQILSERETGKTEEPQGKEEVKYKPGWEEKTGETAGEKPDKEKTVYKKISLRIENIPISKIADLNRGVLMPISREIGSFEFNMDIDIKSADGVSEDTIKNKVKETVSQIGAEITKDESE